MVMMMVMVMIFYICVFSCLMLISADGDAYFVLLLLCLTNDLHNE